MNTAIASKFETIGAAPVVSIAAAGVASGYVLVLPLSQMRPLAHSGTTARGAGPGYWNGANRPTCLTRAAALAAVSTV